MIDLPQVTLICVDTRSPALAMEAMQRCRRQARFADALLFTDPALVGDAPEGIRLVPAAVDSVPAYSDFMLRRLAPHVHSSHLLVVQWDGFIVDASRWDSAFLDYDYIGALWKRQPPERAVGNGGFSLRSARLLHALLDPALQLHHPEDVAICRTNRERLESVHGIRIAPPEVAQRFAYERIGVGEPAFGVHGLFNFHHVMAPEELHAFVSGLPDRFGRGADARDLARLLIDGGRLDTAFEIIAKRRRLGLRDRRSLQLELKYAWARLRRHS